MPARSLAEWLAHLEALHPKGQAGIELGLERVRAVAERLGQRPFCPVVTVAGTNGKGSTCAMLEAILRAAGYRVGLYSSPHLLRYNERVRLGGEPAPDEAFCAAFARVEAARGDVPLTYFEFGTLAAWEMFVAAGVEAVILEVGLGGRLDATNLYDADVAVVTSIDLDHQDYLGPDREAIGREKAGICRAGRPLVCGDADPPESLAATCRLAGAEFWRLGHDFGFVREAGQWQYWSRTGRRLSGLAYPVLRGEYQLANAACAITALDALRERLPVTAQEIRQGLAEVELPGRCQVLPGRPQLVLDVAHNPQAARALAENLASMGGAGQTWALFGAMADKDLAGIVAAIAPHIDHWLVCDLPSPRAASAAQLAQIVAKVGARGTAHAFPEPAAALAFAQARAGGDDRILAFGSFLTVAGVMRALGRTS